MQTNTPSQYKQTQQNETLSQKQNYFRKHIPTQYYHDFSEFCLKQKGNLDIHFWSIDEVVELVTLFSRQREIQPSQSKIQILNSNPRISNLIRNNQLNKNLQRNSAKKQQNSTNPKILQLTPPTIKVSLNKDISSGKTQKSQLLSIAEVMDLLTFDYDKTSKEVGETKTQSNDKTNQQKNRVCKQENIKFPKQDEPILTLKKHSGSEVIKLQVVNEPPLQKRISEGSMLGLHSGRVLIGPYSKPYKQEFTEEIGCRKISPSELVLEQQTSVKIRKHEIIHKAFFLPDYVMYQVELHPHNIVCRRNYDDFKKFYPGVKMPYLESNSWLSETSIQFIKKQKNCLEYFLNQLLNHKTLGKTFILAQFLTITDHKAIKRKFEQYDLQPAPRSIDQLAQPNAQIKLSPSNADNHFINKSSSFSRDLANFLAEYNELSQTLISNYDVILNTFNRISQTIKYFENKITLYQDLEIVHSLQKNILKQLSNSIHAWHRLIDTQYNSLLTKKEIFFQRILQYTAYQQPNISSIEPLISHRTNLHDEYLRQIESQPTSPITSNVHKNSLECLRYESSQLQQYKNGLLQLPQNTIVTKYHLAYWNTKLKDEIIKMLECFGTGMKNLLNQRLDQFLIKEKNVEHQVYTQLRDQTLRNYILVQ